jgi:hypothetical protein
MDTEEINAIRTLLADLSQGTQQLRGAFDHDRKALRLNEVNAVLENPAVWNEPKRAQELGKEAKALETAVGTIGHLQSSLADSTELYEMSNTQKVVEGDLDAFIAASLEQGGWPPIDRGGERGGGGGVAESAAGAGCTIPRRA